MLTLIEIRNFKRFRNVKVELGKNVVFVGPNNSGKTTALQALALWDIGLKQWNEKYFGKPSPEKRPGVTINRNDLISLPVPTANLLWKDLHTREMKRKNGEQDTKNIRIEIVVHGITDGKEWKCGLEFDYANEESLYCRPLRLTEDEKFQRMPIPTEANRVSISFLPPMSGLAAIEPKWERGRIGVLLGEGQTAQVLRNLCFQIYDSPKDNDWKELITQIQMLFGVTLLPPKYIKERGEITMSYQSEEGIELDISSSGRGLQQILLLLAFLYANPQSVLLLDEPDAHLEVLRQRQIYQLLTNLSGKKNSQIIAASHSEVVMNEAADRDIVIAFVGSVPHRIDDRGQQVSKSLKTIGFEQYYQAEQKGWVLYLEGSTDLAILQSFAEILSHSANNILKNSPFVYYVGNQPKAARAHFYGLQEAKRDLVGLAIFDRIDDQLNDSLPLKEMMWKKRELENYLCKERVLLSYAEGKIESDLFSIVEAEERKKIMKDTIAEISNALFTLGRPSPWSDDIKASDEFLDRVFELYFKKLNIQNVLRKTDYHILTEFLLPDEIDNDIIVKLDAIVEIASLAKPTQ